MTIIPMIVSTLLAFGAIYSFSECAMHWKTRHPRHARYWFFTGGTYTILAISLYAIS